MRVEIAVSMLLRNIVADPGLAPYVFSRMRCDHLPIGKDGDLMRDIRARMGSATLSMGELEDAMSHFYDQSYISGLKFRSLSDARSSIDRYIEAVNEFAELQSMRSAATNMALRLAEPSANADEIRREFISSLSGSGTTRRGLRDIGEDADKAVEMIEAAIAGHVPGQSVGFGPELDEYIWLAPANVTVLAGSPGSAKTSFIVGSMMATATTERPHAFFSLEMAAWRIATRMAIIDGKAEYNRIMRGKESRDTVNAVQRELQSLGGRGIYISDSASNSTDMYFEVMTMDPKPSVVWIDYSELVQTDDLRPGLRDDLMMAEVFKSARRIAIDANCHVVILSQIGRESDKTADKWPSMRELSRTSFAEKMADQIILLMRPEYYLSRGLKCKILAPTDAVGVAYAIIAKARDGAAGVVRLDFESRYMRFGRYTGPEPAAGMAVVEVEADDED